MDHGTGPLSPARRGLLRAAAAQPLVAGLALAGCAAFDYREPDAPQALALPPPIAPAPRLALVLGSGGPRGYAHIGVLRVLEDSGVVPDLVVGSSVGALIGAFWASGMSAAEIDRLSFEGGPLTVFDPSIFADRGWIHGRKLQDYVDRGVGGRRIEDLPRRLIVAATRRDDRTARYFASGRTGVAVRASGAMPGILSPVGIAGVEYEDGDTSVPVPVAAARAAGARFVIAVDITARETPPTASRSQRERDRQRRVRIEPEVAQADFVIHPDLDYQAGPWRSYFIDARQRGEIHARERLPALRHALARAAIAPEAGQPVATSG
ncbi:MAG: patatin-like phospholipase family protein [Burkholderiales bacterium]|nr:patatin-like phospholipase family protein [Burkholderiales bacterium]